MSSQDSVDNSGSQQPLRGSNSDANNQPIKRENKPYSPGFLDTLFGIQSATSNAKPSQTLDNLAPPAVPDNSDNSAIATESEVTPRLISSPQEGPLKPHFAHSRAELIFKPSAPTVYITPDAYKRICLYVELAPQEVGWLGTVSKRPDGNFIIDEVFLVEQEVTAVETELSVDGCAKLVVELLEGGEPGLERANKLQFWGHSHVRMGTTPSGTDEQTMRRFADEGHEFYVRGIFNKLGRGTFDVYYFNKGYRILDVPWAVMDPRTGQIVLEKSSYSSSSDSWLKTWRDLLGNGDQRTDAPPLTVSSPVHEVLVIDDALRSEVTADYNAKVKERRPKLFRWLTSLNKDQAEASAQQPETANGSLVSEIKPASLTWKEATGDRDIAIPKSAKTGDGGFCSWLASLFQTPPILNSDLKQQESDVSQVGRKANSAAEHTKYGATHGTINDTSVETPDSSIQSKPNSPLKSDRGDLPS